MTSKIANWLPAWIGGGGALVEELIKSGDVDGLTLSQGILIGIALATFVVRLVFDYLYYKLDKRAADKKTRDNSGKTE